MITIYSADSEGRLFTDPKQHFYLDAALLQEKAYYLRRQYLLDQIAQCLGYDSFDALDTYLRCSGVTAGVRDAWIASGNLAENLPLIENRPLMR